MTIAAAARVAHPPRSRLAAVERAAEVDRDHVLPLLRGHRVDVADLAHARAVDEHVDAARRRRRRSGRRASTAAGSRTSPCDEEMRPCARLLERRDELVFRLARAVEAGDPRALAGEELGDLPADAAAGTRHECDSVLEQHARLLFSLDAGGSPSSIAHMDEAVATNAPWEITGARHGGITVSDLDRSLEFYVGLVGLELVWRRRVRERRDPRDRRRPRGDLGRHRDARHPRRRRAGRAARVQGLRAEVGQHAAVRLRHRPLLRLRPQHRGAVTPSSPRRASASAPTGRSRCWRGRTRAARASTASTPTATSSSSTSGRPMSPPDVASAVAARPADRPPLIDQYRLMLLIRAFEERAADALRAGRDLRHGAQLRRPGGDRRRRGRRDARDRLPRRPPPLARPPDRRRRRPAPDDGRDVRQADGLLQGARRLDAHRRPLARHPRLQRHRRRRDPPRLRRRADRDAARHRPGDARLLRRRRRRAGRDARGR